MENVEWFRRLDKRISQLERLFRTQSSNEDVLEEIRRLKTLFKKREKNSSKLLIQIEKGRQIVPYIS